MKLSRILVVGAALGMVPAMWAQRWEFGGGVGGSFYTSRDVTNGATSASASIETNVAGSLWLDNSNGNKWGGEVRFDYERGDLKLSQGSTQATFGADTYAMHYDFQYHFTPVGSKVRPFVAAGAGVKFYHGIGPETVFQPLAQYALLTKATETRPMISLGAGVKWQISHAMAFRIEVHDYLTSVPKDVFVPNVGSSFGGWFNNIVPMAGISYVF